MDWLSPNRRWARWLAGRGVPAERILEVTRWADEWRGGGGPDEAMRRRLLAVEAASGRSVRNVLLMDPLLRRRPEGDALRYLAVCARRIDEYLADRRIEAVFGEQTWAFELLVGQLCRARGIPHLLPHTVRVPDGRFAFFDPYRELAPVRVREVHEADRRAARETLATFREHRPRPAYMAVDRAVLRLDPRRLHLLWRHVADLAGDPWDETSRRPLALIADHTRQALRARAHRRLAPYERSLPVDRPFVLFPLHMQPEATIDVKGQPYTDQAELVRAMVRTLPLDHELWVKEHPSALARRPRSLYRELLAIPGVRLLAPELPTFDLIERAALVVTVTGTAAYEAALLGRPAATIAPIFFEEVVRFPRFDPFAQSLREMLAAAAERRPGQQEPEDFLTRLFADSFPGLVGDALWQPQSLQEDNLERVADGFLRLLAGLCDRRPTAEAD
ncbi:MAG TPA: hypothetical protein VM617_07735 [Thermoanaerobaculia bacterium]|nr:hypothetical protein [Thermoanaerobaculia bacterium]